MHFPGVATGMFEGVELLHGERIDVGSQTDCILSRRASGDDAHHARSTEATVNGDSPLL